MNINNAQLLSLLFDEPKLTTALNQVIPYISVFKEQTTLNLKCASISSLFTLLQYRQELFNKLSSLLGYEICLECEESGASNMIATSEIIAEVNSATPSRFFSLETLSRVTNKPIKEVKSLLGKAREVIHPTVDGQEMITESAFDAVVLEWAKSIKDDDLDQLSQATSSTLRLDSTPRTSRKTSAKVLISELTVEDITKIKNGEKANSPNLTKKGVEHTLDNFFKKVNMDDMSSIDTVSAFIEGATEFGQALRKKLLTAYKKFTLNPNLQDVESKLVEGAKAYLESRATEVKATTAAQE